MNNYIVTYVYLRKVKDLVMGMPCNITVYATNAIQAKEKALRAIKECYGSKMQKNFKIINVG